MKLVLFCVTIGAIAFSNSLPIEEEHSSRYVIVHGDVGFERIDLEAPVIENNVASSALTLHFYNRKNPTVCEDFPLDVNQVLSSPNFDKTKLNVFSIHGWTNDHYASMNMAVRDASLEAEDVNLFVVDWSGPASGNYLSASGSVGSVGEQLGTFIGQMQKALGLGAESFKLVGYSLGAHVAGSAGRKLNGNIGVIIGLDPAGPLFSGINSRNRLRNTDAQFVHVIHTNGGTLGYSGDLGDADYRPNGGSSQPGCGIDIGGGCAHSRAYQYYAESITSGGFTSWLCASERQFNLNNCANNPTSPMGGLPVDTSARGNYYLNTNNRALFSLS